MRDPQRIDSILARIAVVWKKFPDLRLGQIIGNSLPMPDPYYVEDDTLIAAIEVVHTIMEEGV